ncbi:hypothetical protein Tco_1017181 [Tanacetum coccineum]|uniref:Uncharacterized protein n=1 Tax=Tanacetum coccineum TaxID=301880 RepID=A0ABQ5FQV4_9ASTR
MLSNQKPSGEKLGLGFSSFEESSSGTKEIKFVKAHKKASSDGGPINIGDPILHSTWMAFGGNTRDLGLVGEETDKITDLHQDSPRSIVLRAWRRSRRHKVTPS